MKKEQFDKLVKPVLNQLDKGIIPWDKPWECEFEGGELSFGVQRSASTDKLLMSKGIKTVFGQHIDKLKSLVLRSIKVKKVRRYSFGRSQTFSSVNLTVHLAKVLQFIQETHAQTVNLRKRLAG